MPEWMDQYTFNQYSNIPEEMLHYWHAFMCTDEFSSPHDDWTMYCMGHQL